MTIAGWPVLLGAVVVNADNKHVVVTQNGVTETLSLVEGTYYLRGDEDPDDLKDAITAMLATHSGGDTYSAILSVDESAGQRTMRVSISRATGSHTFSILWGDNATTFDPALVGFAASSTAVGTSCTSTLSPTSAWVSDEVFASFEPVRRRATFSNPTKSGKRKGGERSVAMAGRTLELAMISEERTSREATPTDVGRAFDSFLEYVGASLDFEVHLVDLSGGLSPSPLSSTTRFAAVGQSSKWQFDQETASSFEPQRLEPGLALYDWTLRMWAVPQ